MDDTEFQKLSGLSQIHLFRFLFCEKWTDLRVFYFHSFFSLLTWNFSSCDSNAFSGFFKYQLCVNGVKETKESSGQ